MVVDLLVGDRAVELVGVVALGGIEVGGRVGQRGEIGDPLRRSRGGQQGERAGAAREKPAAIEKQRFRRGEPFRNFPAAAADDIHGHTLSESKLKGYGPTSSQASHGCGSADKAGTAEFNRSGRSMAARWPR